MAPLRDSAGCRLLGDAPDQLSAKVAQGIKDWRPENAVGQIRMPGCNADIGLADLKIIEDISVGIENGSVVETEDTMTLLDTYIDEIDIKANKSNIKNIMRSLYVEASAL